MSDATKVDSDDPAPEEVEATDDPKTKEFQEKYYPLSPSPVNKYDPYTLQSTIDTEIIQVSADPLAKIHLITSSSSTLSLSNAPCFRVSFTVPGGQKVRGDDSLDGPEDCHLRNQRLSGLLFPLGLQVPQRLARRPRKSADLRRADGNPLLHRDLSREGSLLHLFFASGKFNRIACILRS